ncbi:hypothetical protein HZR84_07325 [Hyphobacterium sp. CCMP332]|nr:hypothetical protein HZR84_07325 [Hyphobacterium sp. CCMP332]
MKNNWKFISVVFLLTLFQTVTAQVKDKGKIFISEEAKPTLDLNPDEEKEEEEKKDKKKKKKRVFYGLKTKKAFTPAVKRGRKVTIETYHVLKEFIEPNPYVKEVFWFDVQKRKIGTGRASKVVNDKKVMRILHGPYKKYVNKMVVEEGNFYIGTKHGRWVKYDLDTILVDKEYYYKGWPKESDITYYDIERTKIKEVVPIVWGRKEGDYVYFNENGTLRVTGTYKENRKVGRWRIYHPGSQRRKMDISYPRVKSEQAFIMYEWDKRGNMLFDYRKADEQRIVKDDKIIESATASNR